ncbi:MAG TPA: GPW/gp25 family protein [Pyrinomonadaceae bacterium]|nr:GPW/gp25 family protein [Pyrinomonadaceae bacterium]
MSNAGKIFGKGISFPPRIGADGRIVWSEGEENIRESIKVILLTELNERLYLPNFGGGLNKFLFEPNTATTRQLIRDRITKALAEWEPRITVQSVSVEPDTQDLQTANVTINYKLVATQSSERVGLTVTLGG